MTCAYLEVYNEILFDLLVKNSGPLELREDADQGVQVAGLKHVAVDTAGEILVRAKGFIGLSVKMPSQRPVLWVCTVLQSRFTKPV